MDQFSTYIHRALQRSVKTFANAEKSLDETLSSSDKEYCTSKMPSMEQKCENLAKSHQATKTNDSKKLKILQDQADLNKTKLTTGEKMIAVLKKELDHLHLEKATFTKVSSQGEITEQRRKALEETEAQFKKYLATEIMKVKGGWMQIVFTEIDHKKPERKFFFSLKLDESRRYIVGDCHPEISDMDHLEHELNATNDLATFVNTVRKRMKGLVQN